MLVSHKLRAVFLRNPKGATESIDYALLARSDWEFENIWTLGLGPEVRHQWLVPQSLQDYRKFTTVRNPYSRAVSTWAYMVQHEKRITLSWTEFLWSGWLVNAYGFQYPYLDAADFAMKVEDLKHEMVNLALWLGLDGPPVLGNRNTTKHSHWSDYYSDPKHERRLYSVFRRDFEQCGYERLQPVGDAA